MGKVNEGTLRLMQDTPKLLMPKILKMHLSKSLKYVVQNQSQSQDKEWEGT